MGGHAKIVDFPHILVIALTVVHPIISRTQPHLFNNMYISIIFYHNNIIYYLYNIIISGQKTLKYLPFFLPLLY